MSRYETVQRDLRAQPRTWLVTGCAGFIGSNLVEKLLNLGQTVVGLDNFSTGHQHNLEGVRQCVGEQAWGSFQLFEGDIRDLGVCREACVGVDFVLHQAALGSVPRSVADPAATHAVNLSGTLNILIAARDSGVQRTVYASSSSVYGDHLGLPKVEDVVGRPLSPYAVSKRGCEFYAQTFQQHYGLPVVGLRYFNVFGRRQDPKGAYAAVVPKWIGQMLAGEACTINGNGETSRDFCYVANVVQANLLAATAPAEATGQVFNIAYGDRTTLRQLHSSLVRGISELTDGLIIEAPVYTDFRPGDIAHSLADTTRSVQLLGYAPSHSLQDGLREAMMWYQARASIDQAR